MHRTKITKALLFDLDGTIIDTYDVILLSMRHAMRTVLGKEYSDQQLMKKVGQPLRTQMSDYARSEEECEELLRVYRAYQAQIHDDSVRSFSGTQDTLEVLKQAGYPLGIVTSKMHDPALHGLRFCGLDGYFSCLVGADDCTKHKPDPFPVVQGAGLLGVEAKDCMYIGDSPYDIQAGNAAGAVTVAALWGMFAEAELKKERPDHSCEHIADIIPLLDR